MTDSLQRSFFILFILIGTVFLTPNAKAAGGAIDHTGWKVDLGGYIDLDGIYDSTRSFTEVPNNGPVLLQGTTNGDNGRFQESARNSRFRIFVVAPEENGWHVSSQMELDFNGFNPPPPGVTGVTNSETSFYTSPTPRMRLAYVEFENDGLKFKAGQGWSLFGWQPYYELSNLTNDSIINVVNRTPMLQVSKNFMFGEDNKLESAISVSRPEQRDSDFPDLTAGVNFTTGGRKAGYLANSHTNLIMAASSVEVSGVVKQFSTPNSVTAYDADKTQYMGGGLAASALIPILASSDGKDSKNTLSFLGEFVKGSGLAEQYTGFTGGLPALNTGTTTAPATNNVFLPNLDAGFGGYDANGNFTLVQTQSFTAQLQYILPTDTEIAVNIAYGQLHSPNMPNLFSGYSSQGTATSPAATFDNIELYTANVYYALTKNLRVAGEYDRMSTHYISSAYPINQRFQTSVFFMF